MMVNRAGISRYSATTLTPPFEISVIVQSRGREPAPDWIFAILLHERRSVLRRLTNISTLHPSRDNTPEVPEKRWDQANRTSRNLSVALHLSLPGLRG